MCATGKYVYITVKEIGCLTTEWLPWLQTSWGGGGCERFTLVLHKTTWEAEPDYLNHNPQILTAEQTSARETHATIKGMNISMTDMISRRSHGCWWDDLARRLSGCPLQLVSNTKVKLSQPLFSQLVCNQSNHSVVTQPIKVYVGFPPGKATHTVYAGQLWLSYIHLHM